jgi:hypothetical protein
MTVNKLKYFLFFLFFIVVFTTCDKTYYYPISDEMKQFFSFQKGTYWIYKNDSTSLIDSTYVDFFSDDKNELSYSGKRREYIIVGFKSQYLSQFRMIYTQCAEAATLEVGSRLESLNDTIHFESGGDIAYCPVWPQDIKIASNNCIHNYVFLYRTLSNYKVNGIVYKDSVFSSFLSRDSSETNPLYYKREIYFAKNIGIIKYFEKSNYFNINRSWSILRNKIIQ